MPLVISDDGARHETEIGGGVFYFTPCGWGEYVQIRKEKRDKDTLQIEEGAVEIAVLKSHLVGWEEGAVVGPTGKPVAFSYEAVFNLPPWAVEQAVLKILAGVTAETDEQGNSESSSNT